MEIWKYPINREPGTVHSVPADHCFLSVGLQHGEPQLWLLVDDDVDGTEPGSFVNIQLGMIGTGQSVRGENVADSRFLGTIIDDPHRRVWHIFAKGVKFARQ